MICRGSGGFLGFWGDLWFLRDSEDTGVFFGFLGFCGFPWGFGSPKEGESLLDTQAFLGSEWRVYPGRPPG
jgi:hypothetical protein